MQEVAIEFTAGNLAGWAFITMGMPLDLIKTRLQLGQHGASPSWKDLLKENQGFFKTFYRGASSMYLFFGLATALEFSVFESFILSPNRFSLPREFDLFVGGFLAGTSTALIYTPI
jgi:hypothetical protein